VRISNRSSGKKCFVAAFIGFCVFYSGGNFVMAEERNPLLGKWEYVSCTIKNTSVSGVIEFKSDHHGSFNGKVRQDFPTSPQQTTFEYVLKGSTIENADKLKEGLNGIPILKYFLVKGNQLYFSWDPIKKAEESWDNGYLSANWQYKLKRVN
jgi:hypothetical protein